MSYAVVTTKIDPQTKKLAMKTAEDLGLSLSVVIKAFLKQFIHTRSVTFSSPAERPSKYLRGLMRQAEKDFKAGRGSPSFDNSGDAISFLNKNGV